MANEIGCPKEILTHPLESRLAYFSKITIAHPLLIEAYEKLRRAILEPAGSTLIFVIGPTGVGKTTLQQRIKQKLDQEIKPLLDADPGRLPIVSVEAVGPDSGNWSWKDFYKRILSAMDEPLIEHKVDPERWSNNRNGGAYFHLNPGVVAADLRRAVEQALLNRRPPAVLIDEAQHIAKVASGRRMQDQWDCVKSLANMTKTVHVFFGSYELVNFCNLSGQLSRRSIDIHFRRYCADSKEDILAFQQVLWTFEKLLPLREKYVLTQPEESEFIKEWKYFYERSMGCVGILKDWLYRALADVLEKRKETLTLRDLKKHAYSLSKCLKIASDAIEGETRLKENESDQLKLLQMLRLEQNNEATGNRQLTRNESSNQARSGIRKLRVGEPKPNRYPSGIKSHAD